MSTCQAIAACIVAFRPDAELITKLARRIAAQVGALYVFNNGGVSDALVQSLRRAGAELIGDGCNVGVAHAFNVCAQMAAAAGKGRLLLLDQDSDVAPEIGRAHV